MENKQEKSTTQGQTSDQSICADSFFDSLKQTKESTDFATKELLRKLNKKRKQLHSESMGLTKSIAIKLGKYGFSSFAIGSILGFIIGGRD